MTYLKILNQKEKEQIESKLKEQFGINEISGILAMRGQDRIFLYTGGIGEKEMRTLEEIAFIERLGVYFAKIDERTGGIRLSIEGTQILGKDAKKNIFEIPKEELENWMKGRELNIKTGEKGFLMMKHGNDFLGTGKASVEKIGNFIPKNRRLKEKNT